ncbi:hypothetical protein V8C26DRAFT_96082 [Trichoderma gracile]
MHHHLHHHFLCHSCFSQKHSHPHHPQPSIPPLLPPIRPACPSALKPPTLTSESFSPLPPFKAPMLPRKPRIGPKPRHHDHRPVAPQMPGGLHNTSPTSIFKTHRKK